MTTIKAEEVRIPRRARDAVARHDAVLVVNRERPSFVIVHPDDHPVEAAPSRHRRRLHEALRILAGAPMPDPAFAQDMDAVLSSVGSAPGDPWAPS